MRVVALWTLAATAALLPISAPARAETLLSESFTSVSGLTAKGWTNGGLPNSLAYVQGPTPGYQPPPQPSPFADFCDYLSQTSCALSPALTSGRQFSFLQSPYLSAGSGLFATFWLKGTNAIRFATVWETQNGSFLDSADLNVTTSWQRFTVSLPALGNGDTAALTFADARVLSLDGYSGRAGLQGLQITNALDETLLVESFTSVATLGDRGWLNGSLPDSLPYV